MLTVRATLVDTGLKPGTAAAAQQVEAVLWAHATAEHGLEHVRVQTVGSTIGVVLFLRTTCQIDALAKANSLLLCALTAPTRARFTAVLHVPDRPTPTRNHAVIRPQGEIASSGCREPDQRGPHGAH
ncbi:hypothetical protein SAMN05192558_103257 [Actinokineospora alba]|uniref:Uncharacterized protein n=1 Tax=Actinokineospora alba TaxID=504798 RepID=A0A1H0JY02_9PSEU|nr:hypothetical protein [Actinokineospora alba]TDP68123.1 hypothetical protein C8E96_3685 [Actinokineospora alba]SDH92756.1 hypothetical protein SAMN05421871_102792 [Actinokineospora alba]SDO48392.1 hypothetical protein SAMN05192558_103257 [Actinokineospora alba]